MWVLAPQVVATQDGKKQIIPGSDGELCWYSDVFDAKVRPLPDPYQTLKVRPLP